MQQGFDKSGIGRAPSTSAARRPVAAPLSGPGRSSRVSGSAASARTGSGVCAPAAVRSVMAIATCTPARREAT
jgi:hypothetical protein